MLTTGAAWRAGGGEMRFPLPAGPGSEPRLQLQLQLQPARGQLQFPHATWSFGGWLQL